mmetsp:Transcript_139916/g.390007  ORF Transcript_139916/g.390007 Transcript_139916/m.390007 type:complete len:366 (-) Transcript_139916:265-1362(-)
MSASYQASQNVDEGADQADAPLSTAKESWKFAQFRSHMFGCLSTSLLLALYLLLGGLVYHFIETYDDGTSWTGIDSLYFTTMTMSTVGYGDLSPSSDGSRAFTLFMIFVGIGVIFPRVAGAITALTHPITNAGRAFLERRFPQKSVDIDGDNSVDYKVPRHPVIYYSKNLSPVFLLTLTLQLVSAGIFTAIEDWTFYHGFYHCMVTGTTVGYGDMTIATQGGRFWAILHMMLSVCLLGELISTIDELRAERADQLRRIRQLERQLDRNVLQQMVDQAKTMRPHNKDSAEGLSALEFALGMLIELEMVKEDHVRPFIKQFEKLDTDKNGRLSMADLSHTEIYTDEARTKFRHEMGEAGDVKVAPEG